ncbi:prepilin peptidase [Maritimibacter sp. HL-12]|jgi:prepilin peptidase CpaA|uniref:A24 family peptidase n=1 Tax=Maritimibacter sp. HL-12 TaxID=1162418 RepID=UPI000A0F14F6|nr:prepilin peptidase [Maritimibacter sp. HL-12]SMH37760.1 prepilin peptidase CpaA [Maritimibacter sp. HL-12]
MQEGIASFAPVWFIGGQIFAGASDAIWMRIPNALILFLLLGYLISVAQTPQELAGPAGSAALAVGLSILAGGLFLFARGWMGGGDVKLLAVNGLWLGPAATPAMLLLTALAGGLLTLVMLACRTLGPSRLEAPRTRAMHDPKAPVPYGIAIATAAIAVVLLQPRALLAG